MLPRVNAEQASKTRCVELPTPLLLIAEDRAAYANHQNEGGARDQCTRRVPSRRRRNKQEKRREELGRRVQPSSCPILGQLPVHATFSSDSNLNISRIVPALVAFWTDSTC